MTGAASLAGNAIRLRRISEISTAVDEPQPEIVQCGTGPPSRRSDDRVLRSVCARAFWNGTQHHDVSQNYLAFLNAIEGEPPYSILDLGCGPGRDLSHFRSFGMKPSGSMDLSRIRCHGARTFRMRDPAPGLCFPCDCLKVALMGFLPMLRYSMSRARNSRGFCWNCPER